LGTSKGTKKSEKKKQKMVRGYWGRGRAPFIPLAGETFVTGYSMKKGRGDRSVLRRCVSANRIDEAMARRKWHKRGKGQREKDWVQKKGNEA